MIERRGKLNRFPPVDAEVKPSNVGERESREFYQGDI